MKRHDLDPIESMQETLFSPILPLTADISQPEERDEDRRNGNLSKVRNARTWLSLVAFVAIVAAMDYLFLDYVISQGLEVKSYALQVGSVVLSIPLVSLTFIGVLIVATAAWSNMAGTMPVAAVRDQAHLETVRILRAAGLAVFFFSVVLYGPYVIGASVFWTQMASVSRSIPQLAVSLQGLLNFVQPAMALDALTKLAISQNAAAASLVAVSALIGYTQRRIRRTR